MAKRKLVDIDTGTVVGRVEFGPAPSYPIVAHLTGSARMLSAEGLYADAAVFEKLATIAGSLKVNVAEGLERLPNHPLLQRLAEIL
jgi:hypothetical protein